jgi:hypothetical protein
LKLLDSARCLGGLRAVELACFARLGERAPHLAAPDCARWAASSSLAHGWRASLLEGLLPVSVGLPSPQDLTVLPDDTLGKELARVLPAQVLPAQVLPASDQGLSPRDRVSPTDDGLRLIADLSGQLYPVLLAAYLRRLEDSSPAADGAVARVLGRAVADLEVVRAEGTALIGSRT